MVAYAEDSFVRKQNQNNIRPKIDDRRSDCNDDEAIEDNSIRSRRQQSNRGDRREERRAITFRSKENPRFEAKKFDVPKSEKSDDDQSSATSMRRHLLLPTPIAPGGVKG